MLIINTGSEQELKSAILNELGMNEEQAVRALANKLGVKLPDSSVSSSVQDGQRVVTDRGESVARTVSQSEQDTLRQAASILNRVCAAA